ncbi:FAD-linked oxidase C-terminal domain-containing protein [Mesorhizobium sp. KR1-2]|uniref:FAD-linked oxidase C-terminal domain-containing protein n=1 Tax=Mesorhizobium sp. KR1-2 TaxID=3156609 RepID=UPI0032B48678
MIDRAYSEAFLRILGFERRLRDRIFGITVEGFGGSFSAEHAIGRKKQAHYEIYTNPEIKRLAQGLKAITSPGQLGNVRFG